MTQHEQISKHLQGSGGGKGSAKNDKNTLRSNATVQFVALLSDGEIVGPTRGDKDIILDDTRLQADNGYHNFRGVKWDFRSGMPDQAPFDNFKGVETETTVGVKVSANNPVTRSLTDPDFTHCRVMIRIPALFKQEDDGMKRTSVRFRIEVRHYNGGYIDAFGPITLSGKNTSGYDKSYLIKLPQATSPNVSFPWDIRVTRISPDAADNTKLQNEVYFASITGIIDESFIYPDSALLAMSISAEDFEQGLPTLSVEGDGAIIKVPSNYDPELRTYTGIWNGTFKEAYTDNPAWIYYDVVTNKRVGMGEFIPEGSVDKWALYEIGAYCDQMIPDGFGGMEPRFRMAAYLTDNKECYELLQLIASAFRGMSFWSSGSVTAVQDRPTDPVQLVTRANVIDGEFVYSSSSHTARHTVAHVRYMDPNDLYRAAVEVVRDNNAVLRYGERVKEVNAFGCVSRGQARRLGAWILQSELNETQTVTYRAGMDHASLKPGDDILIMDERISGVDNGGRIKHMNSRRNLVLDRPVTLAAGKSYSLYVMMPDGSIASRAITGGAGTRTNVILQSDLPDDPVTAAVWVMSASDVAPRPFRVLANTEKDDHVFEITALQKHTPKYSYVDNSARFDAPTYQQSRDLIAPTNLTAKEYSYFENGVPKVGMTISWEGDAKSLASVFRVEIEAPDDSERFVFPKVSGFSVDLENVTPGIYTIRVYTVGLTNGMSEPASLMFDARGWGELSVPEIRDLELADPFNTPDCSIRWKNFFPGGPTVNSMFKANTVEVYGVSDAGTVLRRTDTVFAPNYVYTIAMNKADGPPARRLLFKVTATFTIAGQDVTSLPEEVSAYNAPIPAPTVKVDPGFSQLVISWGGSYEPDYVTTKIWAEYASGYDPKTTDPVYEGNAGVFPLWTGNSQPRYIRVAHIDSFSDDDFIASSEVMASALEITFDTDPPEVPTGLALTSEVLVNDPGFVKLIANWNANTEDDLAGYDVHIKEGSGNYVSFVTSEPTFNWRLRPGVQVTVKVSAFDAAGNKSAFSAPVEHTTAVDDIPPAVPSNVRARSGIDTILIEWDRNTEPDLSFYELFVTSDDSVLAPPSSPTATYRTAATSVAVTGVAQEESRYAWVRAWDTSGNASEWSAKVTGTAGALPELDMDIVNIVGVMFKPGEGANGNKLTWTAGQAIYGTDPTVKNLTAGSVTWSSGSIYVYYVKDETVLRTTTNLPTLYTAKGTLVGVYRGGLNFRLGSAESYTDGGLIIARTIGADQLAVDHAVITGSAQIANAIIGDAHVNELSANKLKAGTALANSITVDGRAMGSIANVDVVFDNILRDWLPVGTTTSSLFYYSSHAYSVVTGTRSLVTRASTTGVWLISPDKVPFDPAKLYRIKFKVRRASGSTGGLYLGVCGFGSDGETLVNYQGQNTPSNQYFCSARNKAQSSVSSSFTEFVGYIKGHAAQGSSAEGTLATPTVAHEDVRFITPMIVANHSTGDCLIVVDSVSVEAVTEEGAAIINAGSTQIDPGKVLIAGSTSLADWRSGGDNTQINGGAIAANTVDANKMTIGQRGLTIEGLQFEANGGAANRLSWTSGTIRYIGDDGNVTSRNITASNANWTTGTMYVCWVKGATTITTTTNLATAMASDRVVLAAYRGNLDLITEYGRTVIDGSQIKTGSIKAAQADIDNFRTNILVAGAIKTNMLDSAAVTTDKLAVGKASNWIDNSDFSAGLTNWGLTGAGTISIDTAANVLPEGCGIRAGFGTSTVSNAGIRPLTATGALRRFRVQPGVRYELSAYINTWKLGFRLQINALDSTGASIAWYTVASSETQTQVSGKTGLDAFVRRGGFWVAPANAAYVTLLVRYDSVSGQTGGDARLTRMFFGEATDNQTELTPWAPNGITTIGAGHIDTPSLAAINANLGAITAGSLNINNRFIVGTDGKTTIRSGTSGQRTEITDSLIRVFDASNVERVRIGVW